MMELLKAKHTFPPLGFSSNNSEIYISFAYYFKQYCSSAEQLKIVNASYFDYKLAGWLHGM